MRYSYDARGVEAGEFPLIPNGWWPFRIVAATPGESKKTGDFQVTVDAVCLDLRHKDMRVRHWVTFLPPKQEDGTPNKGVGMALHFLSCINQPHEGKFDIDTNAWVGKTFMGKTTINEYDGRKNNKFESISPIKNTEFSSEPKTDEDDPF